MSDVSDIKRYGYETGTFKLGQTVFHICNNIHSFRFHKKCKFCESTGLVLIKGKVFKCPECNGAFDHKEIIEKVIEDIENPIKIKSVLTLKNRNKSSEIYTNDSSGYGLIIRKQEDGTTNYFSNREEAQKVCDEYNRKNNVYTLLDEYNRQKIREGI